MIDRLKKLLGGGGAYPKENPVPKVATAHDALAKVREEIFRRKLTLRDVSPDMQALEEVRQKIVLIDETLAKLGPSCKGRKHLEGLKGRAKFTEMQLEMRLGILCPPGCEMEAGA